MATYVPLPGSRRAPLPNSRPAGPVDKKEIASLSIRVRSAGDTASLEKLVREQATRPLNQRQYLTREDYARQYGADAADLDLLETLAQEHDLMVVHRSAG